MTVPREDRLPATTPQGIPTLHWLMEKFQSGEMTAEEFVKLSKIRGRKISETAGDPKMDTRNIP